MMAILGPTVKTRGRGSRRTGEALGLLVAMILGPPSGVLLSSQAPWMDGVIGVAHGLEPSSGSGGDPAQAAAEGMVETEPRINPDGYTSARVCGSCHEDIYNTWKNSLHAFSLSDPIFDVAYMHALKEAGDDAKQLCLRCHAPMTMFNGDFDLDQGVTREGVSCDFCHTITEVDLGNPEKPYSADPGLVKRSVLKEARSPTHEVVYSDLHGKSEFCGGCHNYSAPSGVAIMSTYEEWRNGPYAEEGIQCQNCHMVLTEGSVVSSDYKTSAPGFHLHNLIHDTNQLKSAMQVRVLSAERTSHGLNVEVEVENVGSGHMVPTGMPSREVVLRVSVESKEDVLTKERRYRKVVADEIGRPLTRDFEMLLRGARILTDNRIAPREKRREAFRFDVPEAGSLTVKATLTYVYSPMVLDKRELNIKLSESEKAVL